MNIDGELTADLVGDYLFTDADFVRNLSTNHQNVFQKIFDEIKYLYKVATAGSKEARELEKIKKTFEKVYQETVQAQKNTAEDGVKYSLSKNAKSELHKALYDMGHRDDITLRDETPAIMLSHKGVKNLPMVMKISHIRENVFTESEARRLGLKVDKHTHYHGLGEEFFLKVIDGLDEVTEAYRGTKNSTDPTRREEYFLLVSQFKDANGNIINVPVYINGKSEHNRVYIDVNKIATVFGRDEFRGYINKQIKEQNHVRIKNRSPQSSERDALIAPDYRKVASDTIIAQTDPNVNTQNSLSAENEDLPARGYQISGKDVALDEPLPLRESVSASKESAEGSETLYTQEERSKRLGQKLQRIDKRLEREKADLKAEFENRRQTMEESLRDKNDFVSSRASELYEELRNLKKGVRASESLGYLLDHGYQWSDLKTALLNVKNRPGEPVNQNSEIESTVREMLSDEYSDTFFELDHLDDEYQRRLSELEQEAEENRKAAREEEGRLTRKDVQDIKINEIEGVLQEHGYDLQTVLNGGKRLSTLSNVDNTPQRVFEKTFGYKGATGMTNAAVTEGQCVLEVIPYSTDWVVQKQTIIPWNDNFSVYMRTFYGGTTWAPWKQIV